LPPPAPEASGAAASLAASGVALLAAGWALGPRPEGSALTAYVASLLLFLCGLTVAALGIATFRRTLFPILFLALMIPLPGPLATRLELAMQSGSADVAYGIFRAVGTPVFLQGLTFQLPGITIEVAPECSGIRSTFALFITSLVAANLLLNSNWRRLVLVAVVVPLAVLRNGFRVFVVGQLCVTKGPQMIDSYIHRRGGPYFFLLSLVPLIVVLVVLMRFERKGTKGEI
jgi:exosortase C (VPDSG-CTERM-specific)